MVKYQCKNCRQKIKVPDEYVGRRLKCPKCATVFTIQNEQQTPAPANETIPASMTLSPAPALEEFKAHIPDFNFPVAPKNIDDTVQQPIRDTTVFEEHQTVRKLSPIIDVFLYPASFSGIMNIVVFFIIRILLQIFAVLPIISITRIIVSLGLSAYLYYYLIECIKDSAQGGIRAPDNMNSMPDNGSEAASRLWEIFASFVIFWGPVIGYSIYLVFSHKDPHWPILIQSYIFWSLLVYGYFFFPIGILAIAIFDSSSGYNPFLWIASIFSTFFQYILLLFILTLIGSLYVMINYYMSSNLALRLFITPVFIYFAMVAAHILGRFYFLNSKSLNWDA